MFITITNSKGESVDIPLTDVGGKIRFAIGEPGHRSSIWTVYASKTKFDVYIASRELGKTQKFSLHETGDWRYAFVSEWAEKNLPADVARIIDQWERAEPTDAGWIAALALECRASDLSDFPDDLQTKAIQWVPAPPEGHYVSVRVSLVKPDTGMLAPIGGQMIGAIRLSNDWAVFVIAALEKIQLSAGRRSMPGSRAV